VAIDFEELPEPLKPVRATLTLTVRTSEPEVAGYPWGVYFYYQRQEIRWLSEPSLTFAGPYTAGDVYRVPIEFVCLRSGGCKFELFSYDYSTSPNVPIPSMTVGINLDRDGNLTHLWRGQAPSDYLVTTVFFTADSVSILGAQTDSSSCRMFAGDCTVVPAFRIGEPSKVCFNLRFLRNYPNGLDLEFSYGHMEISELPPAVRGPVYAGDEMQFCVTAVPLPVREVHDLAVTVYPGDHNSSSDAWIVGALFNDDKSLRYVNVGLHLGEGEEKEQLLPKAFPPGTRATCGSKWVLRSE